MQFSHFHLSLWVPRSGRLAALFPVLSLSIVLLFMLMNFEYINECGARNLQAKQSNLYEIVR